MSDLLRRIVLLSGHRKSGTTMFLRLFDGHRDALCYPVDLSIFYAYFPKFTAELSSPKALRERLSLVLMQSIDEEKSSFECLRVSREDLIRRVLARLSDDQLTVRRKVLEALAACFLECYREGGSSEDKSVIIFKETSQAPYFANFFEVSSEIEFCMVNLVRDPRDVYSALKAGVADYYAKLGEDYKETLASLINRARVDLLAASVNQQKEPKSAYMNLRFEDLVECPEQSMREISNFIGIGFDNTLLCPTRCGDSDTGNSYDGIKFRGISGQNVGRWNERLTNDEVKIIEFALCDEMRAWGYRPLHERSDSLPVYAEFFSWYNARYFFNDRFEVSNPSRGLPDLCS